MHISIFFGGSTEERGISINSARAAFEMLQNLSLEIHLFYVSPENNIYEITENNIYSNTPDDFAFILDPIDNFWSDFSTNFAIPLIHGPFGEDGQIQRLFEEKKIPFLFSDSQHLANMFLKDKFCNFLWQRQFPTGAACHKAASPPCRSSHRSDRNAPAHRPPIPTPAKTSSRQPASCWP